MYFGLYFVLIKRSQEMRRKLLGIVKKKYLGSAEDLKMVQMARYLFHVIIIVQQPVH